MEKLLSDQDIRNLEDNSERCEENGCPACELSEGSVTDTTNPGQLGLNNQLLLRRDQRH